MASQYIADRKVTRAPAVERVERNDRTEKLDQARTGKFQKALARAADNLRIENQRQRKRTFDDSEQRLPGAPPRREDLPDPE
jgi:hypothetical protein